FFQTYRLIWRNPTHDTVMGPREDARTGSHEEPVTGARFHPFVYERSRAATAQTNTVVHRFTCLVHKQESVALRDNAQTDDALHFKLRRHIAQRHACLLPDFAHILLKHILTGANGRELEVLLVDFISAEIHDARLDAGRARINGDHIA